MREYAIVAARTHRLEFALRLTIKPVIEVTELSAEEQATLEHEIALAIQNALADRALVTHAGQSFGVEFVGMKRDHSDLTKEEWQ